jgi:hypothetical protein
MHHDGSNSARARSSRIRAAHDGEATRLESMRRNARARDLRLESRGSLAARLSAAVARVRRRRSDPLQGLGVEAERDGA